LSAAINPALNSMIGSKPNKRCFKLWKAIRNGIGALNAKLARRDAEADAARQSGRVKKVAEAQSFDPQGKGERS
jgi:hypothetical protein